MAKNYTTYGVLAVIALLVGGIFTYAFLPRVETKTEIKEVEVKVPTTVIVEKNITVEVDKNQALLDQAVDEFIAELEDNDLKCGKVEYDADQVSVSKIYDGWTVQTDTDRHGNIDTQTVDFEIKMKYSDADVEQKCYKTYDVEVVYEDGEKPVVNY